MTKRKVVYLVLPVNLDELTDEQLDEVAGGRGCGRYHCSVPTGFATGFICVDKNDKCDVWWGNIALSCPKFKWE